MTIELRSIHKYPESDGWLIHWKSQSFEAACEIRDVITPERNPFVAGWANRCCPSPPSANGSDTPTNSQWTVGGWLARSTLSAPPSGCAMRSTKTASRLPASPNPGKRIYRGL